jgi:hypothetical protein
MGENLTASNTFRLIIAVEHCANLAPFARRASHRRDRLDLDHEIRSVQLRYRQRYRRRSRRELRRTGCDQGQAGPGLPLVCDHGFRADGDACVKITCRAGYRVNDNECEKVQDKKPLATREQSKARDNERKQVESSSSKPQAKTSGQMVCGNAGCRPIRQGCRLEAYQQGKHGVTSYGGRLALWRSVTKR